MEDLLGRLEALIDRCSLHDGTIPVDLTKLEREIPAEVRDLDEIELLGFVVQGERPVIVLDENLSQLDRRLVYAHEVGHVLHGHQGSLRSLELGDWFHDRQEREAWQVAANLLIPIDAFAQHPDWTVSEIAGLCEVPVWLAELLF